MYYVKKANLLLISVILTCLCSSCEPEEDFGFPSRIEISGGGETLEIKGSNDLPPGIIQIQVLDFNGDGNNSGIFTGEKDYLNTTTDWLTVKYYLKDYKMTIAAKPNETNKKRKLSLYLLSGNSRQEIKVTQSK